MMKNAELLRFEIAEEYKKKYQLLDEFEAKSEVVNHTITDVDVFTIVNDDPTKRLHQLYSRKNGTINQSFTYEYKRKLESDEELLITAIPKSEAFPFHIEGDNRALRNGMEAERCNLLRTPERTKAPSGAVK